MKKSLFLVMVMIVGMIGLSSVTIADEINATLTEVQEAGSILAPISKIYYINNGSYLLNFTLYNLNNTNNVTGINVTLDSAFTWGYGNWTNASSSQFINLSNNLLRWNLSVNPFVLTSSNLSGSNTTWFAFNVTINQAGSLDGKYNFTFKAEYNNGSAGKYAVSFNISNNVTVDNTKPVLASAVTHNRTAVNLTFTEAGGGIKGATVVAADLVINKSNSTNLAVSSVEDRSSDNKTITAITASFSKNETPLVTINTTHITDWAGNNISSTIAAVVTASDRIKPSLEPYYLAYNYSSRNLTLFFDEPISTTIYPAGIHLIDSIKPNSSLTLNDGNVTYKVYAADTNKTVIQLSISFRDTILGWKPRAIGLNISLLATVINDTAGNQINATANQTLNIYVNDTTAPFLTGAYYSDTLKRINLTFSETLDSEFGAGNYSFIIGNQANLNKTNESKQIKISATPTAFNSTSIEFNVTEAEAANLSSWRVATLYILVNNVSGDNTPSLTFPDLAGNNVTETIANSSARGYVNGTGYINDTTAPSMLVAALNDSSPTKSGLVNFSITFNEYMDRSTSIVVKLQPNTTSNSYTVAGGLWLNYTVWVGNYSISSDWFSSPGDGISLINVTGARDVGYNVMAENSTNSTIIDTTAPTLVMAWYNDTGYDYNESTGLQTGTGTDYLILKFSENVTIVSGNDTNAIYLANESNSSISFPGNQSTQGGSVFLRNFSDYRKIEAAISENTNATWVRGVYGSGKYTGVILKNGSTSIVDNAGNTLSNSTGVKDIYDNVLTLTANASGAISWTGFSIPHDFTSTAMVSALATYTGTIYTHNGSAWSLTTTANLKPLRGYMIKITGMKGNDTFDLPIQTPEFGGANPDNSYTTSVQIKDGAWSLVAVDGYDDNTVSDLTSANQWLAGLGVTSAYLNLRDSAATSTIIGGGGPGAAGANNIQPYRAYWLWVPSQTNQPYPFS